MFLRKLLKFKNTLLFRLTFLYSVIFIFSSLVIFLIFYHRVYSLTMDSIDSDLLEKAELYSESLENMGLKKLVNSLKDSTASENPEEEFFRLVHFNGDILFTTDMSTWGPLNPHESIKNLENTGGGPLLQSLSIPGAFHKARMISAIIGPNVVMQAGDTLKEADDYLKIFRNLFSMLFIILIAASGIIGWFLARRALKDMQKVVRTAENIIEGDYDKRVEIKGQLEEIKQLSSTFNEMLDRIQNLLLSMKEINDNIAHDLRSPLARIRGIAEMTLLKQNSIDNYKNMAVSTMEECDSLIDMINAMLEITEAEAGINSAATEEFDLIPLLADACELFRPIADEKNLEIKVNFPETLRFRGDKKKMQRIISNLLENAIKYTPEGGSVTVSSMMHNGNIDIMFEDTGIGISESDIMHIFERFYRCDRSRSQSGAGLGLSLAKAYAESMHGSIGVKSIVNQGSVFTLSLPHSPS